MEVERLPEKVKFALVTPRDAEAEEGSDTPASSVTSFSAPFAVRGAFSSVLRHHLHYGQEKLQYQKSKSDNQLTVE